MCLHTLHIFIFLLKMEKEKEVFICGPDNIQEFKAKMKELFPEFCPVIVQLLNSGLITGLRGAKIEMITQPSLDGESWQTVYQSMIDTAKKHWSKLNEWEMQFITSVDNQLNNGRNLSQKQIESLERINEKL